MKKNTNINELEPLPPQSEIDEIVTAVEEKARAGNLKAQLGCESPPVI